MRTLFAATLCAALVGAPAVTAAQALALAPADGTQSVVAAQKGKRITVRLRSGQELSGLVREVNERLLLLGEVSGREFFDAVVPLDAVEAILVRVRQ